MQADLAEALEKIAQLALDAVDLSSSIYPNDYEAPFDDMRALLGAGGPALKLRVYSFFCAAVSMVFCLKCFREHPEVVSVSSSAVSSAHPTHSWRRSSTSKACSGLHVCCFLKKKRSRCVSA